MMMQCITLKLVCLVCRVVLIAVRIAVGANKHADEQINLYFESYNLT